MMCQDTPRDRFSFTREQRLRRRGDFAAVYESRVISRVGPLRVHGRANGLGWSRLGLSISARVGNAVKRNRIKRLLREAFRLLQHELPRGYDLVVVAARHEPLSLEEYQRLLAEAARKIERQVRSRSR